MSKILRLIKILLTILYVILIFFLMFKNEQITSSYNLPAWIIPGIFFISILYICYKYIILTIREDRLEKEIISMVNHTFRTPLTNIIWDTKELEKNLPQNEKFLYLQNIKNGVNKILNIVDILTGIKNIANTSGYFFEAISIREIVEKSIKKYRDSINKKNIIFQVSIFKDIPLLTIDLKKISFVIDTVIENAISYTKKDGRILIDCISNSKKLCTASPIWRRPADKRTRAFGMVMRATAMVRTNSNGSSGSKPCKGVPSTCTRWLIGTDSG